LTITIDPAALARATANADGLADLADAYRDREAARREAAADVARIERAWKLGDDGPSAQDHVLAVTEVTRSGALADRYGSQLSALHNAAPVLSFDFANEVAERVSDLYGGVRTVVSDQFPAELPKVGTNPVLYVLQRREAHDEGGGMLAGSVDLILYGKSRIIAAPPREDFQALFDAAAWHVNVTRSASEDLGSAWKSTVRLNVVRAWLPVPVIDPDATPAPQHAGNRIATSGVLLLGDVLSSELGDLTRTAGAALASFNLAAASSNVSTDSNGVTHELLTVRVTASLSDPASRQGLARALFGHACAGLVGVLVPTLGVVAKVTEPRGAEGLVQTFDLVRREPVRADNGEAEDAEDDGL
jgi:hypothetical protein